MNNAAFNQTDTESKKLRLYKSLIAKTRNRIDDEQLDSILSNVFLDTQYRIKEVTEREFIKASTLKNFRYYNKGRLSKYILENARVLFGSPILGHNQAIIRDGIKESSLKMESVFPNEAACIIKTTLIVENSTLKEENQLIVYLGG